MWHPVSDSSAGQFGRFYAQTHALTISMENVSLKRWFITWTFKIKKRWVMEDPSSENKVKKQGSTSATGGPLYSF